MDNQGAGGSAGASQRQSALPSSLIPLMYSGPHQQRGSASPSQSENTGSPENPPSSTSLFPSIPPSPSPAFNIRPIDAPPGAPITPDGRPPRTSRLPPETPERANQEAQRTDPSPIPIDLATESRLGAAQHELQSPLEPSFTFPPVPRFQHLPYPYYGEDEAGPSTIIQSSRERSTSRRPVTGRTLPPLSISTWPGSQLGHSPLDEPERPEWADEQRWHEEQQRQRQTSEPRHAARIQSQSTEPVMSDPSASVPTYLPNSPIETSPGGQQELQLIEPHPHLVYVGNPYVTQTQSYTPIAPPYYPRYFDAMAPVPQTYHPDRLLTPIGDQSFDSEEETSNTSHRQGKRRAAAAEDDSEKGGSYSSQAIPSRSVDDDFDDDDDDDGPRKKVPRKTEVACDFCRRRKLRCDGVRPTCRTCETRKEPCTYVNQVRRRGPGKAPKGSKKMAKRTSADAATGSGTDAFPTKGDIPQTPRTLAARPDSVGSVDNVPRYSPQIGGSMYSAASASPPRLQLRNAPLPHVPSQSPAASTSELVRGSSRGRRPRRRTANEPDRSRRSRRDAEADETDDPKEDDDMPFDGQPPT